MYLVINKCVTAVKVSNFSCHYLRNRSTLDIGVLGYIGIVQHKEHSPEVLSIPPGTLCIGSLGRRRLEDSKSIEPGCPLWKQCTGNVRIANGSVRVSKIFIKGQGHGVVET